MRLFFVFCGLAMIFTACTEKEQVKYQQTDAGLSYYYYVKADTNEAKAKVGDNVVLNMKYYIHKLDTILFNSDEFTSDYRMKLKEPSYEGGASIEDALAMMRVGDSMSFLIRAKDFYEKTQKNRMPFFFRDTDYVRFDIGLVDIMTDEEIEIERQKLIENKRKEEQELIEGYVQKNYPDAKMDSSGIYSYTLREGSGDYPQKDDYISINYIGKFISGEEFHNTYKTESVFSFTNAENYLLPGMQAAIDSMRVGEKSVFIVPFDMAFGDKKSGVVPPFSTLIFEIEMLDIARYN